MNLRAFELPLLILLAIPTLMALINGAPFVPTPVRIVKIMIQLAKLKPGEKIVDIGCGDGRIVHLASKHSKVEATGFELSPLIYFLAKICQPFWHSKAKIQFRDFRKQNYTNTDVIFCYVMPGPLKAIRKKWEKELKPGSRVISYAFPVCDWKVAHKEPACPEKNQAPIWVYEIGKHR